MDMIEPTVRTIHVDVIQHKGTGLFMTVSRDLPGLHVAGHSLKEVEFELPLAIGALIEASEQRCVTVAEAEPIELPPDIERRFFTFAAAAA